MATTAFFVILAVPVLLVLPVWRIFDKAGFPGVLSLGMLIPGVNLGLLYFLAFSDWPALRGRQ